MKKRVARILVFKIRPSQEILKIRDGTPLEAEGILTYRKKIPRNGSVWNFSNKLDVPSNVVQKKRVARILVFKIRPSQEILKIRDVQKKRVARILVFKIRPSQEILKIRDGTPLEAEGILTYRKKSLEMDRFGTFPSKLDVPSNVLQKKRVARILVFKIRPSQEILKIRDGGGGRNFDIQKKKIPRNGSVWNFYNKLSVPSNVVQKKRVARILVFKIRPSQEILKIRDGTPLEAERILTYRKKLSKWIEILKIRDGTPLEAEGILTYRKKSLEMDRVAEGILTYRKKIPRNGSKRVARILVFKIRPSQEILKIRDGTPLEKRVARILVFKIRPSQEILKIRDGTPLEAEGILTYRKKIPRNGSVWNFSNKLDVPSNVVQKKRVARILVFKIRPSQEILKIRDGTLLEKRVARILVFKIRPSQEILKIRDGTPLEAEGILTYRKKIPRNGSVWHFSNKLDVPSNVLQKKRVARILVFKIRPSQEILKIRDGTPLEKRVARILVFKIRPSQEILKIRDGTPLEAEGILTYRKKIPRNGSVWNFSNKLDVPSNVVQKKRVARILVFKIRPSQEILKIRDGTLLEMPSQEILKIRDGTPLEAEGILTYRKKIPRNGSVWHFSNKLDVPSNVVQKKRVARILVFKIRPSQEILKIRDGTLLEAEGILTYRKKSLEMDRPSQEILKIRDVQKKRVARILVFKIRPSQEILKIRDGTPLEAEGILTYRKKSLEMDRFGTFPSKLDVPSNVLQKKRVARILVFKIRPSQEILKIRDGGGGRNFDIQKKKIPRNGSVWNFSNKLYVPSNVVQKKRVARILVFKIRPSQEILKIRDGTPLEAERILTYRKKLSKWIGILTYRKKSLEMDRVARILVFKIRPSQEILKIRDVFKIRPSQEILKIRDGTPLEAEGILTYRKKIPRNGSVWNFSNKLDVPSNVVQKKRVARILVFKIRPSQEILKIRDGTLLEMPSQEILKIRDGTPLEAEGILTYRKKIPRNGSVWHFSNKLDVPSNVVQKKRVARILVFKIRPSQEILKIRDGTLLEAEGILTYRKKSLEMDRPSQEILKIRDEILKIRDGTPLEAEGILTYRKKSLEMDRAEGILTYRKKIPRNGSVWNFSNKLYVPSNVVQKKRVARILVFKIRPSQEILKIRDGTPLEKRVARILVFKIRPSQEILKIRDGTPLEAEGILTYRKKIPRNGSVWHFSNKLDVPSNVVQKKRVARILVFKIRPSQEILKIRDGTLLEKILKIRDGTPLEAEGILTYRKKSLEMDRAEGILTYRKKIPRNGSVWNFSNKLYVPSNVVQKKRVARILVFKIRPSQEILKIRDGTPLEAERILTYRKKLSKWIEILKIRDGGGGRNFDIQKKKIPRNGSVWNFSNKLYVPSNVVQKKRVARILVFKIRPSQEILKIRDGTPLE
ncbi:hypothetical protein OROHE_018377 [Orobanche hederae]